MADLPCFLLRKVLDPKQTRTMDESFALRVAGIFVIFFASVSGVASTLGLFPGRKSFSSGKSQTSPWYLTARSFAAGIMLGVAFMHLLADANASLLPLTSGCEEELPTEEESVSEGRRLGECAYVNFPALTTTLASIGALMVLVAEQIAIFTLTPSGKSSLAGGHMPTQLKHVAECDLGKPAVVAGGSAECSCEPLAGVEMQVATPDCCDDGHGHDHDHDHDHGHDHDHFDGHGHNHSRSLALALSGDKNDLPLLVKAVVMEVAIAMHSVVIGVAFGALGDVTELVGLLVALSFHQLFEGVALGANLQAARAQLGESKVWAFAVTFVLTTPIGILIGMFALPTDEEPSVNQEYAQGILNAVAAGNLIYIALVEMVSEDFRSPLASKSSAIRAVMLVALLAGDLCMAILAIWA